VSGKHLEGRTGKYTLCGVRMKDLDPYTQVTYPERDGIQVRLCRDCEARIPRAGLSGRLVDFVTGTGRFQK
jgi:hypothetical protein